MPTIAFGEWLPDQADLNNGGVLIASNVRPSTSGYEPMQDLVVVTDALTARPRGARQGTSNDLNIYQYAGDASKLYENQSNSWTDVSITGGYSTAAGERWEFVKWKNKMLATNYTDNPQQITFGGAAFSDLTTAVQGRHIAKVRDFVVLGNTNDSTDGEVPHRVRWSAVDDETDWTVSASTLADFQDLGGGEVLQVVGGQYGLVFTRQSVYRMTFVGTPTVFQFDEILPEIGALAAGTAIAVGNIVYFLSEKGFHLIRAGTAGAPIGANKIDKFVLDDIDRNNLDRVSAASDERRIYWAYPGADSGQGRPNRIVVYDRVLDKWSVLEKDLEMIWTSSGTGSSLEDLDSFSSSIDDLEASLDADVWKGDRNQFLSAFDVDKKSGFFNANDALPGTIITGELELSPGRQSNLHGFRHLIDGGTVTAKVGTRDRQTDSVSWSSALTERDTGHFRPRSNSRYHRFRFDISGNFNHAVGMQIEPADVKPGGRRGK